MERVSFADAISDENLLGAFWEDNLSWPGRTLLKAFYGLPLSEDAVNPATGWSELDYWAITQGSCEYDDLGYVTKINPIPYVPKEYDQLWANVGRRSGKTTGIQSFIVAYETLLGGHEEYVGRKQECFVYLIAHRLDLAIASLSHIRAIVQSSPILSGEIVDDLSQKLSFKNGIVIVPSPPSIKAQRGIGVPVAALDEVGFWYSDAESANPDFEVERAVRYAQAQFPFKKRIGVSTPWTKEGLLWKYTTAGTEGCKLPDGADKGEYEGILTAFGTTASWENPLITRKTLQQLKTQDPEAFERESLCKFLDSVSGFLNYQLLQDAIAAQVEGKITERPPVKANAGQLQPNYVAAMDPAFRSDSFAFCILHKDPHKGVVVDLVRRYTPTKGTKLNPSTVLGDIKPLVDAYGVNVVYTDQYQFETLHQLAMGMEMHLEAVDFTAKSKSKIFGNLQQLVNQKKLQLLSPYGSPDAEEMLKELQIIERKLTGLGSVQISAPQGKHDDMAAVLALAAYKAVWMDPVVVAVDEAAKEPSLFERGMETIKRHRMTGGF